LKEFLCQAVEQHRWHKGQTAAALGLERKTLYRKMKKYGLC
jgi:transcriptional regulator of acetoin/glycerol metabolism